MPRNYADWLSAYVDYASYTEAPKRMHFWSGVAAIAGALRRRVYINEKFFKWHCNMYIILVAPPGVVSKSTTASIAMNLLRQVPQAKFGPDVVTWQALVKSFADSTELYETSGGEQIPQCALTLESSEFGNLVNPADRDMIDLLVNLWDGKEGGLSKITKGNGSDMVENPWINIIACTTPAWIAGNFPEYVIGGGFTSRCLFVYAEEKEKFVPYPSLVVPKDFEETQSKLVADLTHIAGTLVGEYVLTPDAYQWGAEWYHNHWKNKPDELDDDRFAGYLSRKQTHLHKTAMVLAAACRDELVIQPDDLETANVMVRDLEADMQKVFSRIGRTPISVQAERFVRFVQKRGQVTLSEAYQHVHAAFPDLRNFDGVVRGAQSAGFLDVMPGSGGQTYLIAKKLN